MAKTKILLSIKSFKLCNWAVSKTLFVLLLTFFVLSFYFIELVILPNLNVRFFFTFGYLHTGHYKKLRKEKNKIAMLNQELSYAIQIFYC